MLEATDPLEIQEKVRLSSGGMAGMWVVNFKCQSNPPPNDMIKQSCVAAFQYQEAAKGRKKLMI